jgi:hypothetical protein
MDSEIYQVTEIKPVNRLGRNWARKNAGGRYEGKSHYVVENTWRKMSETGLSIIYMKTMHIKDALHYIYEK